MSYSLILFGPVVWSCGPAQVFGLLTAPYAAYKYFTAKDEKEEQDIYDSFCWNTKAMIPVIGTWIAINSDDKKRGNQVREDEIRNHSIQKEESHSLHQEHEVQEK